MVPSGQSTRGPEWGSRLLPGGIRARLFLLIALALLPVLLLLGWIYYQQYTTRRAQAYQTELEVAEGVGTTFEAYINGVQRYNHAVGQAIITFSPYTQARTTRLLTVSAAQYPTIRNLSWVSADGTVLASSLPTFVGSDLSIRPYFRQVAEGQPWAIGDLTPRGIITVSPTVGIATAVRDDRGALRGIVVAAVEPMRLGEVTLTQRRPAGGAYAIFDRQGVVVYRSPEIPLTWEDRVRWKESDPVLRRALETGQPQVGVTHLEISEGEWLSARVPIAGIGWVAGAVSPVDTTFGPLRRSLIQDSLLALLVFVLAFLLAYLLARTIAEPLLRLEQDAEAMGAGRIETHGDPTAPTEVHHLRNSVERMAADLISRAEALQRNEWFLEKAQEVAHIGSWISDPDDVGILHWSKEVYRIFGIEEKDFDGRVETFFGFIHPDDLLAVRQASQEALAGIRPYDIDHRIIRPDGTIRWVHETADVLRDAQGRPVQMVGVVQDITDRKRAEERDREREEEKMDFYRRTILAATDGKLIVTDRAEIDYVAGPAIATWQIIDASDLASVRHGTAAEAQAAGMDESRIARFILAAGEAATNAVKHAHGGVASLHHIPDGMMFVVSDRGPGIAALSLPEVALRKTYSTIGTLGVGYKVMIRSADKVYLATGPEGTTVGLEMALHEPKAPSFGIGVLER